MHARSAPATSLAPTVRALAAVGALGAGCAHPLPAALLRVDARPDAQLYVDDRYAGVAGARGLAVRLPPGHHRVELRADGAFPAYRDVTLAPGDASARLSVELRPDLDAPTPAAPPARP